MSKTFQVVQGDWVVDSQTGRYATVSDAQKVRQDVRECLTVSTQPNGFGAGIDDLLGQVVDPIAFQLQLSRSIRSSITAMQRLQDQFQPRQRPSTERIRSISALTVTLLNGATDYSFQLKLSTMAGGPAVTAAGSGELVANGTG